MKRAVMAIALWSTLAIAQDPLITVLSTKIANFSRHLVYDQRDPLTPGLLMSFDSPFEDLSEAPMVILGDINLPSSLVFAFLSQKTNTVVAFTKQDPHGKNVLYDIASIGGSHDNQTLTAVTTNGSILTWSPGQPLHMVAQSFVVSRPGKIQQIERVGPHDFLILYDTFMEYTSFGPQHGSINPITFNYLRGMQAKSFALFGSKVWVLFGNSQIIAEFDFSHPGVVHAQTIMGGNGLPSTPVSLLGTASGLKLQVDNHFLAATFSQGSGQLKIEQADVFGASVLGVLKQPTSTRVYAMKPTTSVSEKSATAKSETKRFSPFTDEEMIRVLDKTWSAWQKSLNKPATDKIPTEMTPEEASIFLNSVTNPDLLALMKKVEREGLADMGLELRMGTLGRAPTAPKGKMVRALQLAVWLTDAASITRCSEALRTFLAAK